MTAIDAYRARFAELYENYPRGRYVSLLIIRKTESETIFRTEGSGEGLSKELVRAGLRDQRPIWRAVISKRKQTAVERRTGRELLREHDLLHDVKGSPCALNTNAPCGRCVDCMLYGFAVGGGGAQKSRVITDDAFSIAEFSQVTDRRTFNAPFETGTMRRPGDDPATSIASRSINEDEYIRPETHIVDMETLKDVTPEEFQFVLGNVFRSTRYGAISSRLGRVKNTVLAVVFTDCEIFSNLELTQSVWDRVTDNADAPVLPIPDGEVQGAVDSALDQLLPRVPSREPLVVRGANLSPLVDEVFELYRDPDRVRSLLATIEEGYRGFVGTA